MTLLALAVLGIPLGPPPSELKLDAFYRKYVDMGGLPIVSSQKVPDAALVEAYRLGSHLLAHNHAARREMINHGLRIAIMADTEVTTDIPEHRDLNEAFPGTDWNKRARGLGATLERPAVSAAEENLLGYPNDRYRGESIFIHEFSHAIMELGLVYSDPTFMPELQACFQNAKREGLWRRTYAGSNLSEYWAEAAQSYFDANRRADPPDGIHNRISTRWELKRYDPPVYRLLRRVFGDDGWKWMPMR
jgi:hypothetical protein